MKFSKELVKYKSGKSTIKIPLDEKLPVGIFEKAIKFGIEEKRKVQKK